MIVMFYNFFDNKANMKPATLLSFMQMMDNYEHKINELPALTRARIFNFNYPLSSNINREEFEIKILKHFIMRRIGFETFLAFQLALDDKLNIIMPTYNIMIDNLYYNNNLFNVTESETDIYSGDTVNTNTSSNQSNSTTATSTESSTETEVDNRNSDTPQNEIQDVKDGKYVSDYTYNTSNATSEDSGNTSNTSTSSDTSRSSTEDDNTREITRERFITGSELLKINSEMINIYKMIFDELNILFYGIVE